MRISVTTLDSFRLFLTQDWMKEEDLLATLRGESIPTPQMMLGTAFGRAMERPTRWWNAERNAYVVYVKLGDAWEEYVFPASLVNPQLELFDARGQFEVRVTKMYAGVVVVAKADYLFGHDLKENKTTLKAFNFGKYNGSVQWRFMLDMFNLPRIEYNIFCMKESRDGTVRMDAVHTFPLFSYPDMHTECVSLVREFVAYVHSKEGLPALLEEREKTALKYVSEL